MKRFVRSRFVGLAIDTARQLQTNKKQYPKLDVRLHMFHEFKSGHDLRLVRFLKSDIAADKLNFHTFVPPQQIRVEELETITPVRQVANDR